MGNEKAKKRKVQILSIIILFVFLLDIYLIIYFPVDYILITAAFVTLVFTLLTMSSWFELREIDHKRREEQYLDIMKAQKGTYVISLEMLKDLDEKINFIGQKIMPLSKAGDVNQRKIASMLDGIVEDQKKIAQITISRNKENADALMNSNDRLYNQINEFRDSVETIRNQIARQMESGSQGIEGLGEIKDELFEKMQELTESIKQEMDGITSQPSMPEMKIAMPQEAAMPKIETPALSEEKAASTEVKEEQVVEEAASIEVKEEQVVEEASTEVKEEPVAMDEPKEQKEDPNKPMSPEEIAALISSTSKPEIQAKPQIQAKPEVQTKPQIQVKPEVQTKPQIQVKPEVQTKPQINVKPEVQAKPKVQMEQRITAKPEEKKIPVKDRLDSNSLMSPEEIAALIANTTAEEFSEEPEKFVEEEKPPMPDMSDPNKPMSPEDIAALIANM